MNTTIEQLKSEIQTFLKYNVSIPNELLIEFNTRLHLSELNAEQLGMKTCNVCGKTPNGVIALMTC